MSPRPPDENPFNRRLRARPQLPPHPPGWKLPTNPAERDALCEQLLSSDPYAQAMIEQFSHLDDHEHRRLVRATAWNSNNMRDWLGLPRVSDENPCIELGED